MVHLGDSLSGLVEQAASFGLMTGQASEGDLESDIVKTHIFCSQYLLLLDLSVLHLLGALVNGLDGEADAVSHLDDAGLQLGL